MKSLINLFLALTLLISCKQDKPVMACLSDTTNDNVSRLNGNTNNYWEIGQDVNVYFFDHVTSYERYYIWQSFKEWDWHINLQFKVVMDIDSSDIRISANEGGSWSYLGTVAKHPNLVDKPTMNFGWIKWDIQNGYHATNLHEVGHCLGFNHEHTTPYNSIEYDTTYMYDYFKDCCNWSKERVNHTYIKNNNSNSGSVLDTNSIMMYPIPEEFTVGDLKSTYNTTLSISDIHTAEIIYHFN